MAEPNDTINQSIEPEANSADNAIYVLMFAIGIHFGSWSKSAFSRHLALSCLPEIR